VSAGAVRLQGRDITRLAAHTMVRSGLAFVPQTENVFTLMSIEDNLRLAAGILDARRRDERIGEMYALFPDLAERRRLPAGRLSGGQRQMLAIARALVVSPDVGGLKMASAYSQALGASLAIVAKRRKSATEIEALNVIGEVENQEVILVDDLTETAGTLCSAAKILKERGANKIIACVSHAVLSDLAIERLKKSVIAELITTNSVPVRSGDGFPITTLCIAELLGEGIKRIHGDESVSSLFRIN